VSASFKDWMAQGEKLYLTALEEYQTLERQIAELEEKLLIKREEVNEIARVIGKEPVEASRRLAAEIVERGQPNSVPNSPNTIARALQGRGFGR
jgi:molecular chaperone GrpE (heat shock protein)